MVEDLMLTFHFDTTCISFTEFDCLAHIASKRGWSSPTRLQISRRVRSRQTRQLSLLLRCVLPFCEAKLCLALVYISYVGRPHTLEVERVSLPKPSPQSEIKSCASLSSQTVVDDTHTTTPIRPLPFRATVTETGFCTYDGLHLIPTL